MIKIKFYLSHPIRGSKGKDATPDDMQKNNETAKVIAKYLHENITIPVDIYVPAEMDDFLIPRGISPVYVVNELLALDKKIINLCDAIMIYAPEDIISSGCKVELDHAIKNNIPVFIGKDAETLLNMIANFIIRA